MGYEGHSIIRTRALSGRALLKDETGDPEHGRGAPTLKGGARHEPVAYKVSNELVRSYIAL